MVHAVLVDYRTAPIDESWKALFTFIEKVNGECAQIGPDDIGALKSAGWSEEAIYDAATVCALFNFYNRWIDATGVSDMGTEAYSASGDRMAKGGYVDNPPAPGAPA